jgi:hypothetical protein
MDTRPLPLLILTVAGWINGCQQGVIEYVREEDQILGPQVVGLVLRTSGAHHLERSDPRRGDALIESLEDPSQGRAACRERLGGLLRYCHLGAA